MASIGGAPCGVAFPYGMGGAAAAAPQAPQGLPQTMHPASSQSPAASGRVEFVSTKYDELGICKKPEHEL